MFLWRWTSIRCIFSSARVRVHPVIYFLFKNAIRLLLALLFIGIPVALYFLKTAGIGFGAREALAAALAGPNLEVSIERLAFDPFSGLVAHGVRAREKTAPARELAAINRISISLNISELMHRRIAVDSLRLRDADASIPLGTLPGATRLTVENIEAEITLLGDRMRVSTFEGLVAGIRVNLTGEILNPLSLQISQPPEGTTSPAQAAVEKIVSTLATIRFPSGEPVLRAEFSVDTLLPETLSIPRFTLECPRIDWRSLSLRDLSLEGSYSGGRLQIPIARVADSTGQLQSSANFDPSTRRATISLASSLDPSPFIASIKPGADSPKLPSFPTPPTLDAEVELDFSTPAPSVKILGSFAAERLSASGIEFRDASLSFAWADKKFHARDIKLSASRGDFFGHLWAAPGDYRLTARTSIPPPDLAPLLDRPTREFLSHMEVADLPEISISLRAAALDFASISGNGHLRLGRTAMRGAWIDSGEADIEIADRCISYKNLTILTGPGKGTGSFDYDVGRQEVRLSDIRSTLVPTEVLMWIDPKIAKTISPYRFRKNPSVTVAGTVHMRDPTKNDLAISISAPGGLDYDLLGKTLRFGPTTARVDVSGNSVLANVTRAELMDGNASVEATVSIDPANPVFSAGITLDRVNFSRLTKLYFDYDDSKGVLSGRYEFNARMGSEELMEGSGSLRIEDGNVFAIPLLGPFSSILGVLLPGVVYNTARLATTDFTVANKKINTRHLDIIGRGFSMIGSGDIYFLTGNLDLDMRINAQGIPGLVFFPVSKLFEYHSDGTISDPRWKPKLIPRIPPIIPPKKTNTP